MLCAAVIKSSWCGTRFILPGNKFLGRLEYFLKWKIFFSFFGDQLLKTKNLAQLFFHIDAKTIFDRCVHQTDITTFCFKHIFCCFYTIWNSHHLLSSPQYTTVPNFQSTKNAYRFKIDPYCLGFSSNVCCGVSRKQSLLAVEALISSTIYDI